MRIPSSWVAMPTGDYPVQADIPSGGPVEASASFTVTAAPPSITLDPTHGLPDPAVWTTVTGTGFAPNTPGRVFFDRDRDGVWDSAFERSRTGTTTGSGTFSIAIDVFKGSPVGDYPIRADFPEGGPVEASATFTVTAPVPPPPASLTVSPTSGRYRQIITITGSDFAANTSGKVIFEGDSKSVTTLSDGTFSTTMSVPDVGTGVYQVQAEISRPADRLRPLRPLPLPTDGRPDIRASLVGIRSG